MSSDVQHVAIIGAGAFGTALALIGHRAGRHVTLIARTETQAAHIHDRRANERYLAGIAIPAEIGLTHEPAAASAADLVLFCVPAQHTRAAAEAVAPHCREGAPLLACAKGIEEATGLRQTEILGACVSGAPVAALSGPGFAVEIARGLPAAVTVAAAEMGLAHRLCEALAAGHFRPYASDDPVGVELGGAAKNIFAIACGVASGKGLGESARAALISRGLAEMMRFGAGLGARPETFMGLSGLGDLVLTATSAHSRNTAFGVALAAGRSASDLMAAGEPLAEGARTAAVAARLAGERGVDVPVIAAVAAIIAGEVGVEDAIEGLIGRPLKAETA